MHKSGTTLVSQLLHASGINMGFDLLPGEEDYKKEKCEGRLLRKINRLLLDCGDAESLDIEIKSDLFVTEHVEVQSQHLLDAQANYENWGMKDPRQVFTYQYWKKILPEHKLIVVYRSPFEVVEHYLRKKFIFKRMIKAIFAWNNYNRRIISICQETPESDYILVNYNKLMVSDEELGRVRDFVGVELIDSRVLPVRLKIEKKLLKKIFCFFLIKKSLYKKLNRIRLCRA